MSWDAFMSCPTCGNIWGREVYVSYNYGSILREICWPEAGPGSMILRRVLDGKTGSEAIPLLERAIGRLGNEPSSGDHWKATKGNAKEVLKKMLAISKEHPDKTWKVI